MHTELMHTVASSLGFTLGRYVFFRPDVGYVQGMSHLAAMLLLNLDVFPAFVAFANLLQVQHAEPTIAATATAIARL
jgi:hypothetical protein